MRPLLAGRTVLGLRRQLNRAGRARDVERLLAGAITYSRCRPRGVLANLAGKRPSERPTYKKLLGTADLSCQCAPLPSSSSQNAEATSFAAAAYHANREGVATSNVRLSNYSAAKRDPLHI
jgi:hypothetical protein